LIASMKRLALVLAGCAAAFGAAAQPGDDPLGNPAQASALAAQRPITAIARAGAAQGNAFVAVGQRGHVLRSTDGGRHWAQARVPLSSDLNAVQFVDAKTGFAVGHDGVVLRSDDGGARWTPVLDGRSANRLLVAAMQARVDAGGGEDARRLLAEARRDAEAGPDKPLLDLWFANASEGFVVGAYNLIFHTADGGRSWQPWFDRTDNPKLLNLYAIRPAGDALYIAGEGGLLLRLDPGGERFRALASPYAGSFFGLLGTADAVIAFGMRGHAFASRDGGRNWAALDTGLAASITGGDALPGGRVVLVDQAGGIALSRDGGAHFARLSLPAPLPLSAVAFGAEGLVLGGLRGLGGLGLPKESP
jgi:photosystem II stability/assembly factor-like uncharacterized protein